LRADIDYACREALTIMGRIGVKVWVYRGELLPEGLEPREAPTLPAEEG
jgi:small subunit ribosomal protein S3